ncbi:MAG TPA: ATPase domain-containing protein, partial [Geminicoccaceae bacterium]|nr:ATPase domain-containing protein [Geminicoccaceae bacterium]
LVRDRLYLVEGTPGTGKTTLALQFLLDGARHGETGLYVTLSETAEELHAVALSHGWSLDTITLFELVAGEASVLPEQELTLLHPWEMELGETTRRVFDRAEALQPARIVLDSLSELRLLAQDPLRYRRQILALKQFFAGRRCTVLLLDDRTDQDLQLHSVAHGVITLEQQALRFGAEHRRLRVLKMRGMQYRGGWHDFVIRPGGLVVFPRLVAAEHHSEFAGEPVASGVAGLDALLGGGPLRGTTTLLLGPAGAGKSSIALQYVLAAAERGERASFYMFDERLGTLMTRATKLGLDLRPHLEAGLVTLEQVDPAELTAGEFACRVRAQVETRGARLLVIDSLNGYLNAMPEQQALFLQMHELLSYLNQQGVATFVIMAQHGLIGQMQTTVDVSYLSDVVLLLRFFEAEGRIRKAISVLKNRGGAHEDTIRELRFGPHGIDLGPPLIGFRGILTGTPAHLGPGEPLLRDEAGGGR